jgi:hypothetical protein
VEEPFQLNNLCEATSEVREIQKMIGEPYASCCEPLKTLCENTLAPVTNLKLIIEIFNAITAEITDFYEQSNRECPISTPITLQLEVPRGEGWRRSVADFDGSFDSLICIIMAVITVSSARSELNRWYNLNNAVLRQWLII